MAVVIPMPILIADSLMNGMLTAHTSGFSISRKKSTRPILARSHVHALRRAAHSDRAASTSSVSSVPPMTRTGTPSAWAARMLSVCARPASPRLSSRHRPLKRADARRVAVRLARVRVDSREWACEISENWRRPSARSAVYGLA